MKHKQLVKNQKGQMLVLMLLIMVVGLTVGLFLVGRTTTDVSVSTKITEATRAFNAAEAGIEEAIRTSTGVLNSPYPFASGATYSLSSSDMGVTGLYPSSKEIPIKIGEAFTTWFVGHDVTNNLVIPNFTGTPLGRSYRGSTMDICYSNSPATPTITPAIAVTLYYRDGSNQIKSAYTGYDSTGASRTPPNNFNSVELTPGNCTAGFNYRANVKFATAFGAGLNLTTVTYALVAIRIRPVYANTYIAVSPVPPGTLPKQGNDITSTGIVGQSTRRIQVKEPFLVPAPFMDSAVYSINPNADIAK